MKLVLLPGLDGTGLLFEPLLVELDPNLDIQIISYPRNEPLDWGQLTDLVAASVGDEPYILLAESFSGGVAVRLCERRPNNLKGVIFAASFLGAPLPAMKTLADVFPVNLLGRNKMNDLILRSFAFDAGAPDEILDLFWRAVGRVNGSVFRQRILLLSDPPPDDGLFHIPSLHLVPSKDKLVRRGAIDRLTDAFMSAEEVRVDGPHFLLQSRPEKCAELISGFAERLV